jgi:hypothetical protein
MCLKIFLCIVVTILTSNAYSQNCDCTIWPVKKGCEKDCGLFSLKYDNKIKLVEHLKIDPKTAEDVVKIKNRKSISKIEDFKNYLTFNAYTDLETKYNTN